MVPAARIRPDDIITYRYPSSYVLSGADPFGKGMLPWPVFPEDDTRLTIRDVVDGKAGFDLLVFGTIGGVSATIVDAFTRTWNVPSGLNLAAVAASGLLGYGAGWWWTERSGWYEKQKRRLLVHCFLAWLESAAGDPEAKSLEFGLVVVGTALQSGSTLMGNLPPVGTFLSEEDRKVAADRVVALAGEYRYRWRRDDFRQWASEVAGKSA